MMATKNFPTFDESVPNKERAKAIAETIKNETAAFHKSGGHAVEVFSDQLVERIKAAGLCKIVWMDVEAICIHPDNREGAMAVPVDVHDLLLLIAGHNGWVQKKCSILGCWIPPGSIGDDWKAKNVTMVEKTKGLLAQYNKSHLKIATARGSHTVCVVRCIKYGTKGIHPEVCVDNYVSKTKILDNFPSLSLPLENGVPVETIAHELVLEIPDLMAVLSRVDNQHHVGRVQTQLQNCSRLHQLVTDNPDHDDEKIIKLACIGPGATFAKQAKDLLEFVSAWSGGSDKKFFKSLEDYEK